MNVLNKLLLWAALAIIVWGLTQGSHKASYVLVSLAFVVGTAYVQIKGSKIDFGLSQEGNI